MNGGTVPEARTEHAEDARAYSAEHSALSTHALRHPVLRTEFALYLRFIGARIRWQMQYEVSFLLDVVSRFLVNGLELAAIFILFNRFSSLGGVERRGGCLPVWAGHRLLRAP